jgi:hypothetical protein
MKSLARVEGPETALTVARHTLGKLPAMCTRQECAHEERPACTLE